MMNQSFTCLILLLTALTGYSQKITTIKVKDYLSQQPVDQAEVFVNNSIVSLSTNHRGYSQFSSSEKDTITIVHAEYEEVAILRSSVDVFTIELQKKEKFLEYRGGIESFYKSLAMNLKYPSSARRESIERLIYVEFKIDSVGSMTDFNVFNDLNEIFSQQTLEAIIGIKGKWSPNYAGRTFMIPIMYKHRSSLNTYNREHFSTYDYDRILSLIELNYETVSR